MTSDTEKKTLREWRAFRKLSKQDAAKKIGVHPSTYAKWEEVPAEIRVIDIPRVAGAFECDPEQIIFFEQNPKFKLGFSRVV